MRTTKKLATGHLDVIHDVCYDYHGKRLATCSSDRRIKIFDLVMPTLNSSTSANPTQPQWNKTADWTCHNGSIWKVDWAHPQFGQVLASCSFDRTVLIWEESSAPASVPPPSSIKSITNTSNVPLKTWVKRAELYDSKDSVQDVRFGPKSRGVIIGTCSKDGHIRIYSAEDPFNLSHWRLLDEFESHRYGCTRFSWNMNSRDIASMAVVGSDYPEGEGKSASEVKIWAVGKNGSNWRVVAVLQGHEGEVNDVCWAANMGRSYHILATCSRDKTVRVWKVSGNFETEIPGIEESGAAGNGVTVEEVACLRNHGAAVWRVEWNVTGTMLASSGDDGNVYLWKEDFKGKWRDVSMINCEEGNEIGAEGASNTQGGGRMELL